MSETWISKNNTTNLDILGFKCVHAYANKSHGVKKGRYSGGISVYYRDSISDKITVVEKNNIGIIWLKIDNELFSFDQNVYICNAYIPPNNSKVLDNREIDIFDEIENGIENYSNLGHVYICGDLNSRTGNLADYLTYDRYIDNDDDDLQEKQSDFLTRKNQDKVIDINGRKLLNLCKSTGFYIVNGRIGKDKDLGTFTFCSTRGLSTTDYLLTHNTNLHTIHDFEIGEFNSFSDHAPIIFTLKLKTCITSKSQDNENCTEPIKIVWDENKKHDFIELLKSTSTDLNNINNNDITVNDYTNSLTKYIHTNALKIFGKIRTKKTTTTATKKQAKWFDAKCYNAKQEFKQNRNSFNKCKTNENRIKFVKSRTKFNRIKQQAKFAYKVNEGKKLEKLAKSDSKKFWKSVKKFNKTVKNNDCPEINELYDHFSKLFNDNREDNINQDNDPTPNDNPTDELLDSVITTEEIRKVIFNQKNNKSPGPDEISTEILKASFEIIAPHITTLFNRIFNTAVYPENWGLGYIAPIFKSGDPKLPKNYRGITLNNIISKTFSQVLLNRLNRWAEIHEKITKTQFGFQKNKSTVDCIFVLSSIISKVLNSGQKLYSVFIDYEKCFDTIDRQKLWQKLINENVSPKMIAAIKSMYSVVRSCIKLNNEKSPYIDSFIGVKQGDPSSSLLFMFFVNDILSHVNTNIDGLFTINELKLFLVLYADDQVGFTTNPQALQSILNNVEQYCINNNLKINTEKTKIMIFEKSRRKTTYDFYLYNKKLEIVEEFNYLGVRLFKNGNFNRTQKTIAEKSNKALHKLFSIFSNVEFSIEQKCKLFDTLVLPVLNYGSQVWGYVDGQDIERIHTKFCRKLLCVKNSTNLTSLYGELGRIPIKIKRQISMIQYWIKLLKLPNNEIPKIIYEMLKHDVNNNNNYNGNNWAYHIKCILDNIGLSYLWINQSPNTPFDIIKTRILDNYYQSWYAQINNSSRLESYCRFKHLFEQEIYLNQITIKKYRIALTQFRLSSHSLSIERGRHNNIPKNERTCILCNQNAVENEYHFLLTCPFYRDLRLKYLKPYFCRWPTLSKFDTLLETKNKTIVLNLSKYIYYSMNRRKSFLSD